MTFEELKEEKSFKPAWLQEVDSYRVRKQFSQGKNFHLNLVYIFEKIIII